MNCGALRDEGNIRVSVGYSFAQWGGRSLQRDEVFDGEHLRGEQTVERIEAEGSAPAQEVGYVGRLKTGLTGEDGSVHTASIDPPEEFQTEALMQLGKIHCGKLASRQRCHSEGLSVRNVTADGSCGNRNSETGWHDAVFSL